MTLASLLKSRGYATGFYGKWHLGLGWTRMNGFTPTWKDAEKYRSGQDADPKTGLNADFTKPVRGGPVDHGFDEAYFSAACSTIDGPFVHIDGDRTVGIPDHQVSEYYDMTKGEEGSPRKGWIVPGHKLEEVDLAFTKKSIEFMEGRRKASPDRPFLGIRISFFALRDVSSKIALNQYLSSRKEANSGCGSKSRTQRRP